MYTHYLLSPSSLKSFVHHHQLLIDGFVEFFLAAKVASPPAPIFPFVRTLSYIRVLGVIELIEFNHSGLFGVVG